MVQPPSTSPGEIPRVAYKVPEAARSLALSEAFVWKLIASGELRSYKVGTARFVPASALTEFVEARLADNAA
ncbi:helix-turn-helix domain-containing protein [Nocardiopsis lucentensis]|uniref:helix-turn-helix domain-containing protein n=1 Tax=Nocardiopsis lucentensis TaxID=53441 RepID=UPI00035E31A3|nr:helix-turn-helix domain-containing protein [Nocardiopsis lucentensis]